VIFLKRVFNFYINASIHVALAVYALVRITEFYFNLPYHKNLDLAIFFGTITGYNFIKYAGIAKLHHLSLTENLRLIQLFSLVCFFLMLYYLIQLRLTTIFYLSPLALLTLLYAVPVLNGFKKNLRNTSFIKIWVIALVWALTTVALPIVEGGILFNIQVTLSIIQRLLLIVVLTLPFDIRDLQFDKRSLQTIPQLLGVERTKKVGFVFLLLTMLIEFFITPNQMVKTVFILIFLILVF